MITLNKVEYDPTFIKLLAMSAHLEILVDTELTYWQDAGWSQIQIAKELWKRVQAEAKKREFVATMNEGQSYYTDHEN